MNNSSSSTMGNYLTEHSFLFTNAEREAIQHASSDVETRPASVVTRLFMPLWRFISVRLLSEQVAPNAITAAGALASLQAYQLISTYYHYGETAAVAMMTAATGGTLSPSSPATAAGAAAAAAAAAGGVGTAGHAGGFATSVYTSLNSFGMRGARQTPLGVAVPATALQQATSASYGWASVATTSGAHGGNNKNNNYSNASVQRDAAGQQGHYNTAATAAAQQQQQQQTAWPYSASPFPPRYDDFFHANHTVQTATALACLLLIFSVVCASVDGVHAKRCRSATSLGDLFARACSSLTRIFTALTMLEIMQVYDTSTKWYLLLAMQLVEFNTLLGRINAQNIKKDKVKNWAYVATYLFRDSELSFAMVLLLLVRWFAPQVARCVRYVQPHYARIGYTTLVVITMANVALLRMRKRHKMGIALCLAVRVVPLFYLLPLNEYNTLSVISDTLVVGLLTVEVYVSHLAQRRIHAFVIFVCVGSLLNDVLAIVASVAYMVGILVDLSYTLNVPLFVPIRNVYIDGVFDLCHAGHKRLMANALKFGNRLIVGVCGDDECANYKRRPIMTLDERVNEVRLCKYVSEVVANAPVSGVTAEMIRYYNIHIVVCGEEYDTPTDEYYKVPRAMGILRSVPRTQGISTSVLIKRIRAAGDDEVEAKDKKSGKSTVKDGE